MTSVLLLVQLTSFALAHLGLGMNTSTPTVRRRIVLGVLFHDFFLQVVTLVAPQSYYVQHD